MTHLSLFSGIGGIDLAAEWAGFRTVAFVEKDPFCRKVLAKHWPEVPIHDDIRELNGAAYRGVFLVSGGFPCQPFSSAGKRRGKDDDRHLWPEMLRVVIEAQPAWVVGENVAGLISMGLDDCLSDLEGIGYQARAFVLPACGVGAFHQRSRVFIVAHSASVRCEGPRRLDTRFYMGSEKGSTHTPSGCASLGNTDCSASKRHAGGIHRTKAAKCGKGSQNGDRAYGPPVASESNGGYRWVPEPAVGRMVDGVPDGVDRIRALGNAVVPQQVYPILKAIAEQCA